MQYEGPHTCSIGKQNQYIENIQGVHRRVNNSRMCRRTY